jgi:hypothetical protein
MNNPAPGWLRWASIGFLLWNLIGIAAFAMQWNVAHDAAALAKLSPGEQAMWSAMPGWAWAAYAIAVLAGTAAAIGLVMRKGWAAPAALVGLIAVVIQFGNAFLLQDGIATVGANAVFLPIFIIVMAALMWWLARKWRAAGWLT